MVKMNTMGLSHQDDIIPPENTVRAAIQWRLALDIADDKKQVTIRINHWCQELPEHAEAWKRISTLQQELDDYTSVLSDSKISIPTLQLAGADLQRRKALKLMILTAAVGSSGTWLATQTTTGADYAAGTGDRRRIVLTDGTELLLNTRTAVDVRFSATERLASLREGEVQINSVPHSSNQHDGPLIVQCRHGMCKTMGARFIMRDQNTHTELLVQNGEVEIITRSGLRQIASPKDRYELHPASINACSGQQIDPTAWTRGMLVVNDIRLDEFISELARYRSGSIQCEPAVASLRLSGVFQLDHQEALLDNLSHTLPVSIISRSRFWVRVVAKA